MNKVEQNEELVQFDKVENTPFTIATQEEKSYILMGMNRLSEAYDTKEEAIEEAKSIDWDKIMKVVGILITEILKENGK